MTKSPKRPPSGKKPQAKGGRRDARTPDRAPQHTDKTSKRGSFRKRDPHPDAKSDRIQSRPARPMREDRTKEPKANKLKADLFGFHAVREAWKNPARFVHALYLTEAAMKEFEGDLETGNKRPSPIIVPKDDLDKAFPAGTVHQGIALSVQPLAEISVIDIIIKAEAKPKSVIVILDQVTDPHNIGAILRSASAFGADGVVMQNRHAPDMGGVLAKTACGAVDLIPVAYETNLSRAIEKLQEHHYTIIGMDEHAEKTFGELHSYERVVIVLGAEGSGMRRLIRDHCDVLVKLPTKPPIASLNVSNAAAVALYALTS